LVEPADRSLTLRDLEAQYYGLLIRTPELEQHLGKEFETVAYTGACRALTNRMSQSQAAIDRGFSALNVWSLATSGAITVFSPQPEPVIRWRAGEWEVTIDRGLQARIIAMRSAKLPDETGGVLFGLVDIPGKRIHLIDASPDSIESPSGFIRGMQGVEQDLDRVFHVTAGQARYVGEWHSHQARPMRGRS
jgi:hypothetical protein